jgi:hypothetical protein
MVTCPHCGSRLKEFIIPLSRNNIKVLLTIYPIARSKGFIETKQIYTLIKSASPTAELTRLKYLGLLRPYFTDEDLKKESKRSGKWFVTLKGLGFIKRQLKAPSYVKVINEHVKELGPEVFIDDSSLKWQKEKDIWAVMQRYWNESN